jgi:hypothetical protein
MGPLTRVWYCSLTHRKVKTVAVWHSHHAKSQVGKHEFVGRRGFHVFNSCILLSIIPPHYYMPPATKKAKKQQEKASHARSIKLLHQSRLVSPAASAGPDPSSSAASTPPISSAGSDASRAQSSHRRIPEYVARAFD